MRGVQASLLTARVGTSQAGTKRRTKHKDDIANAKLVPSILLAYIPPLSSEINRDSVPRYFEYTLVTAYLPKGVHTYRTDQDKVTTLKFFEFNLGDHKFYSMLTPYKYLTRIEGKNLSWLLILITFFAWEILEDTTFMDLDPFEPLAMKFSTLWYSNDMSKKWQSNVVFHVYYKQLNASIRSELHITPNTLHRFQPLINFSMDHYFIYLTPCTDEHQEQLQSYYKLTE
jgi:hypothetical protein